MGKVTYDTSLDTRIRETIRMREKRLHDEVSALANAREEGRAEKEAEILDAMRATGISEEKIQKIMNSRSE